MNWQTIETAPKTWEDLLLFVPNLKSDWRKVCEGYFSPEDSCWYSPAFGVVFPTHYMALPEGPKE